ncbi:MAG TPA: STAS domain-containing protein [Anaerolineaceae bacterium]
MDINYEIVQDVTPVAVVHAPGAVDGSNYQGLIEQVKRLCAAGTKDVLLDLGSCKFLSSAGVFALHSIALIVHRLTPLDPEQGWAALHQMAGEQRSLKQHFRIANIQPNIARTLEMVGMIDLFEIYPDIPTALAAFQTSISVE